MSKGNTTELDVLKLLLKGTVPGYQVNATLYLSLHTGDPTDAGDQTTNETAYDGYARMPITKATGWSAVNPMTNLAQIQFPQCGPLGAPFPPITYVAIGESDFPTAGQIFYSGILNDSLAIANLIQPQFAIGALSISED